MHSFCMDSIGQDLYPSITFNPKMPLSVFAGQSIDIFCNATGPPPVRVTWHAENNHQLPRYIPFNYISSSFRITRLFRRSISIQGNYLRFSRIAHHDAGRYICTATNQYGETNKTAEVIVSNNQVTGSTHSGIKEYDVVEGGSAHLDCTSSTEKHPIGYHVSWHSITL